MTVHDLQPILAAHPFFAGLEPAWLALLVGCARNVRFEEGTYLVNEGREANDFYLLRRGRVAIEMEVERGPSVVATLDEGQILGWSWLVPPHHWQFDARATDVVHAIALDGACLRRKCEASHDLGYELLRRFARDIELRLYNAWIQIADLYGPALPR